MANLIVEDGTGLANANAYIDVPFADDYHRDRNNTAWTGSFNDKSGAILVATEYIDAEFVFLGRVKNREAPQALAWPRAGVCDDEGFLLDEDSLPQALQRATAEMALGVLEQCGALPSSTTGGVLTRRERVGVVESELQYDANEDARYYPRVVQLLGGLYASRRLGGGSSPLLRG